MAHILLSAPGAQFPTFHSGPNFLFTNVSILINRKSICPKLLLFKMSNLSMPQAPSLNTLFLHILHSRSTPNSVLQVLRLYLSEIYRLYHLMILLSKFLSSLPFLLAWHQDIPPFLLLLCESCLYTGSCKGFILSFSHNKEQTQKTCIGAVELPNSGEPGFPHSCCTSEVTCEVLS